MPYVNYNTPFLPLSGEHNLLYAILMQAVEDRDTEWLKTKICQYYCQLLEIDHKHILRLINKKIKKKNNSYAYLYE